MILTMDVPKKLGYLTTQGVTVDLYTNCISNIATLSEHRKQLYI